jgi:3-oxoadipate enol-lactonase
LSTFFEVVMAAAQILRKIVVNGIAVNCCLEGPETAPVVMFGNGLATGTAMWEPQATHFDKRFRVLRYDVRGHGATEATPPPYTIEQLADDVVDFLDRLGIGNVAYVGLSLGGMIGQALAVRHPDRVRSLVLCDTTMHSPRDMWIERIAAIEANGLEPQVEPSIERWFTHSFRSSQPKLVDDMRVMIRATSLHGYLGCAMAMRDMRLESVAPRITQPTLILVGRDDRSTPVAEAQALHEAISGSQLEVIEHAAHLPNIEQASRFNAVLGRFLDAHPVA